MLLMIIGCLLLFSVATPLYARGILLILQNLPLETNQNPIQPTAIVVLGGGLTNDKQNQVILNQYSRTRLEYAKKLYETTQLPIIVSGKEGTLMMQWLQQQGIWWVLAEKNSFNTCENAKFTANLLKINNIILITDPYHMSRARRQFALNHIASTPHPADLNQPAEWHNPSQNLKHSRRAMYELMAFFRDVFFPQHDCKSKNY